MLKNRESVALPKRWLSAATVFFFPLHASQPAVKKIMSNKVVRVFMAEGILNIRTKDGAK